MAKSTISEKIDKFTGMDQYKEGYKGLVELNEKARRREAQKKESEKEHIKQMKEYHKHMKSHSKYLEDFVKKPLSPKFSDIK